MYPSLDSIPLSNVPHYKPNLVTPILTPLNCSDTSIAPSAIEAPNSTRSPAFASNTSLNKLSSLSDNPLCNSKKRNSFATNTPQPSISYEYNNFLLNKHKILNGFTIMHLNIQSLRAKHTALECLLAEIDTFDVMCFSETWLNDYDSLCYNLLNYHHIPSVRPTRSGGSSIFIKNNIDYTPRLDIKTNLWEDRIFEIAIIELNRPTKYLIACIYRSPNSPTPRFIKKLELLFDKARKEKKPILICGDFNIDLMKETSESQDLLTAISTSNFSHLITQPTRVTNHSSTCIDNFITNFSCKITTTGVIETDLSDHYAIFVSINFDTTDTTCSNKINFYRRNFSNDNLSLFVNNIRNQNWSTIFTETNVNNKYNNFINIISSHMNSCFPLQLTSTFTSKKNPWFNSEARKLNSLKYSILKLAKIYPNLKTAYKKLKNIYDNTITTIKNKYYHNQLQKNNRSMRKTWTTINHLTGRTKHMQTKPPILHHKSKIISNGTDAANLLNHHFCTIGNTLSNSPSHPPPTFVRTLQPNSFALFDITEEELTKSIKELKPNSAPGYDEITDKLLKVALPHITDALLHIFNASFSNGIFPDRMKIAKVVPIFKKGDRKDVNNYRPISLLPILSKSLEKIMQNRLNSFLGKHNLFYHSQFGFTKNKSTTDATVDFLDKINSRSKDEYILSVFCDLSKAFDCVNHNILLDKLHDIGIRGLPHNWFKSYLSNRKQFTSISETTTSLSGLHSTKINHKSSLEPVTRGVPQGSILGPLLFNIYINDLPYSNPSKSDFILYADDTSIIVSANDATTLENRLNTAISYTINWLKANELSLNLTKTNVMQIHPKRNSSLLPTLSTNMSNDIKKIDKTKFLGLVISSELSWNHHISHLINRIRPGLAMLYKLKYTAEPKTLLHIYFSLIHSHLNYGILIWGDAPHYHTVKLLTLQKKAIRIILHKDPLTSCRPLFKELSILTVTSMYLLEMSCYAKRLLLNLGPNPSTQTVQISSDIHKYNTRQLNNIYIPNTNCTKLDIKSKCSSIYNKLPEHLKIIHNMKKFRQLTKKYLLSNSLYSIKEFMN